MICSWPVHDNNRWAELCPRSRAAKRVKDQRYESQSTVKVHRYLLDVTARIEGYGERVAAISGVLPTIQPRRDSEDAWRAHCERYASLRLATDEAAGRTVLSADPRAVAPADLDRLEVLGTAPVPF